MTTTTEQDGAPRVLTAKEVDALPVGAVVDATVTGVRVRAMQVMPASWLMSECLDGSRNAGNSELAEVTLVTGAPVKPALRPVMPLPEVAGERFWGRTRSTEPQWWFVQCSPDLWYVPAVPARSMGPMDLLDQPQAVRAGLVRLPDPTEETR
jgi:hypothetical protein